MEVTKTMTETMDEAKAKIKKMNEAMAKIELGTAFIDNIINLKIGFFEPDGRRISLQEYLTSEEEEEAKGYIVDLIIKKQTEAWEFLKDETEEKKPEVVEKVIYKEPEKKAEKKTEKKAAPKTYNPVPDTGTIYNCIMVKGMTIAEIAEKFGCEKSGIYKKCKIEDIPTRKPSEA